jgi:hypothetical protein
MKKRLFTLLIACFAIIGQGFAQSVPITPSTDTGAGAKWYRVKNNRALVQALPGIYLSATAYSEVTFLTPAEASDNLLWCFVGNNTDGFQIYNKALLADGARLIADGNSAKVVKSFTTSSTTWNHAWTFEEVGSFHALSPGYLPTGQDYETHLHGGMQGNIIFYTLWDSGSAWVFEDANTPLTADFTVLKGFIDEFTNKVNSDKANAAFAEKYAEAIAIFETVIASAQAVVDKGEAATQAEVNAAILPLRVASYNYRVASVALPFVPSTDTEAGAVWYKLKNVRGNNYMTYNKDDNQVLSIEANHNSDNQLWCFVGDNTKGFNIYNKSLLTGNARLISAGNVVRLSSDSWGGIWKIDFKNTEDFGIFDAKGNFSTEWGLEAKDFFHGNLDGIVILYGFGDSGSLWLFEQVSTGIAQIEKANDVNVFSRDRAIYVQGAKGNMTITSLTGASVTVDAKTPYFVKSTGIYIVRVNGEAHQVIVK